MNAEVGNVSLAMGKSLEGLIDSMTGTTKKLGSQTLAALGLIQLMEAYLPMTTSFQRLLKEDLLKANAAEAQSPVNPGQAAIAASLYMQYTDDETRMQTKTGKLNNMISLSRSFVQQVDQNVQQVFSMFEAPQQELKTMTQLILLIGLFTG